MPSLYKPRGSSQTALRDGKVCFARIAIESYQKSYVLVLYTGGKRDWRTLPNAPRALAWPSDDRLFVLNDSELAVMDVQSLEDMQTVSIGAVSQHNLLAIADQPAGRVACMAGPQGLSCVDLRVGSQVAHAQWAADESIHFLGLVSDGGMAQLCVVGHHEAALWDVCRLDRRVATTAPPAGAAAVFGCAALHGDTLLVAQTHHRTHTFHSFDVAGGLLSPSAPWDQDHFLNRSLTGPAPFRLQFDRYKCVLGLGDAWVVVDRRSGRVSESAQLAQQPMTSSICGGSGGAGGPPYDLAYFNDTLVTSTSKRLTLWDYFDDHDDSDDATASGGQFA